MRMGVELLGCCKKAKVGLFALDDSGAARPLERSS